MSLFCIAFQSCWFQQIIRNNQKREGRVDGVKIHQENGTRPYRDPVDILGTFNNIFCYALQKLKNVERSNKINKTAMVSIKPTLIYNL